MALCQQGSFYFGQRGQPDFGFRGQINLAAGVIRAWVFHMAPELAREITLPLTPLSEDGLSALLDSNPELTASQSALLLETLLAPGTDAPDPDAPAAILTE